MTCDCMTLMGEKLAEHNTRIIETFGWPRDGGPMYTRPKLDVEKIETRRRVGPALAIPTYCPFCGTKYDDSDESARLIAAAPEKKGLLAEVRAVIHQFYVDWDGEPEDAVPLVEARSKIDALLAKATGQEGGAL